MNSLVAIKDLVIIRPIDEESVFKSSVLIYKPEIVKKNITSGIIIAKGPLVSDDLETGDHVIFGGHDGEKITLEEGGVYFILAEESIYAKLENTKVKMIDTETMKKIIVERMGELKMRDSKFGYDDEYSNITNSLIERIDSITSEERHF